MDWDTRHTWVREVIGLPRLKSEEIEANDRADLSSELAKVGLRELPRSHDRQQSGAVNLACAAEMAANARERRLHEAKEEAIWRYIHKYGAHPLHYARWKRALSDPRYITIIPMQIMPLSKISPDIHMVVEHMVGTLKRYIYSLIFEADFSFDELKVARTYQALIEKAVRVKGNGQAGRRHILRSAQKQPELCKVLAADAGTDVQVNYRFGNSRRTVHTVKGTGGHWCTVSSLC